MAKPAHVVLLLLIAAGALSAAEPPHNLLRNGSFEGTVQYWISTGTLEREAPPRQGSWCLRLADKQELRSASFTLSPGRTASLSFWAKAAGEGEVRVNLSPSNREVGQQSGWAWSKTGTRSAKIGGQWQRVTLSWEIPSLEQKGSFMGSDHGWWNRRSWVFWLGGGPAPLRVDGLCLVEGAASADYVGSAPLEVAAAALDLPGYTPAANLLDPAKPVTIRGSVFNPGAEPLNALMRFEQRDYSGERMLAPAIEQAVDVPAGGSVTVDKPFSLSGCGLVLARVSALIDGKVVESSDQPLTALAFPKAATKPDPRERFGASFRSRHLAAAGQAIGLGWTRWYPCMSWGEVQKKGADDWQWPDELLNDLWNKGISATLVLHDIPKWAEGKAKNLPKDMEDWGAEDPRWKDLAVVTSWDRWVNAAVTRYAGKPVVWEFANEPDLHGSWDAGIYAAMAKRTHALVKKADPHAELLANVTWPGVSGWTRGFVERGGLAAFDSHSFHNYSPGELAGADSIGDLRKLFRSYGDGKKSIWFNEGWTYTPTSVDYPAPCLTDLRAPEVAHYTVRSAANLLAAGLEKFITFHIGYGAHGKSWWDWVGSGTEWWDDHGNPTVAVGAYNVLCHFLGRSHPVRSIRADGAMIHVFHDERSNSGVAVAWAEGAERTLAVQTPLRELDLMGNEVAEAGKPLILRGAGRPWYLVAPAGMSGEQLAQALAALERKEAAEGELRPPLEWDGAKPGSVEGNPAKVGGKEQWLLAQIWPDDPSKPANYQAMPWNGTGWQAREHGHGGQPGAQVEQGVVSMGARAAWGGNPGQKLPALVFIAPAAGRYVLRASVRMELWDGKGAATKLKAWQFAGSRAGTTVAELTLPDHKPQELKTPTVVLAAGERLALVPRFDGMHQAGTLLLEKVAVALVP